MRGNEEDIQNVLDDFFELDGDELKHGRADKEIAEYHAKAGRARLNGKKGGRPKGTKKKPNPNPEITQSVNLVNPEITQSVILANPEITGLKANHKPLTINQEPLTINQEDQVTMPAKACKEDEVFKYWCAVMQKNPNIAKLTPKRKKAVAARLKEGYTVGQIKQAIDGCSNDPFSMGQNDRQKEFNDLELICRTGEKLEGFIDGIVQQQFSAVTQRNINNTRGDW